MEKNEFKILFLDDEIEDENDNPAIFAWHALKKAGYSVEVTEKMSHVITASRRKYYHLYLLDIDMGKVQDEFVGNGATVGEVLRRLSSIRNIIVYSARGKLNDWLTTANYHFYHYVHKDEGEKELLAIIDGLFEKVQPAPMETPQLQETNHSDDVVMYYEPCQISLDAMKNRFENLVLVDRLSKIPDAVEEQNPKLILIVLPHTPGNIFDMETFERDLTAVMALQPRPNVIVCIEANREGQRQFLKIVNAHPFRIINMDSSAFEDEFKEAVEQAMLWYNDNEIFNFPKNEQVQYRPMSAAEIEALKPEDWPDEDWEEQEAFDDAQEDNLSS